MKSIRKKVKFIANYLLSHYKGKYRILCDYDTRTNQFPRKLDGAYEDIDCYISCLHKVRVFSFGNGILQAYIPSIGRGRNYVKAIQSELGNNIIFDIKESDEEVLFKFNAKHMNDLEKYLKPKTSGSSISPFSSKNLPRNKEYKIPDEASLEYKEIVQKLGKKRIIELTHMTNNFLKSMTTKKNTWDMIKADMALKGLKGKEYIHSIGQWDKYVKYLQVNIQKG